MVLICRSQIHSTSQNALIKYNVQFVGFRWKHWLKFHIQSSFSISFVFHNFYRRISYFNSINHFVTIKSNVLYQFESYLEPLSCMNISCLLRETGALKIDSIWKFWDTCSSMKEEFLVTEHSHWMVQSLHPI